MWCEGVRGFPAPSATVLEVEWKNLVEAAEQLRRRAQKKEWWEKWLKLDRQYRGLKEVIEYREKDISPVGYAEIVGQVVDIVFLHGCARPCKCNTLAPPLTRSLSVSLDCYR